MITIDPKDIPVPKMHSYLLGAVAPRPIAFASTIDKSGNVNLSPFSFFNVFSSNPPILIFSPSRRGRDNTTKNTFENVREVPEVVINIVDYSIVQQASLASTEYEKGVNEFIKSGLTQVSSVKVKPPRVGESPISFECKVNEVVPLGDKGGAGNLVICEVLLFHIYERVLDEDGRIDPWKLDAVARMGGDYYCRAQGEAIFTVPKPLEKKGIGVDQLPEPIRLSKVLSGNELALLANVEKMPGDTQIAEWTSVPANNQRLHEPELEIHKSASQLLQKGNLEQAWLLLLAFHRK